MQAPTLVIGGHATLNAAYATQLKIV